MLERKYDPTLPYRYACYGRMSDPRQNKRSPDQQFNTIEETRQRCGYPWQRVVTYRDDGISGRKVRKRPGLQKMLRDIEVGLVRIDLIVVDTYERLGRAEEIGSLRHKLLTDHGILVVAADNGFADPTGIVGKAVGLVEQIRATENTRVSRHNVIRGKKDVVRLRRWPGGPRPFGYRLKPVVDDSTSPPDVYHVLEPEPKEAAAQVRAFLRAAETGEGDMRLSQWWNNSPEIPAEFRPMSPFTMGYRLSNPIYVGTLVWGENRTGVVNDTRVVEPNPDGAEVVPDFCPPLVSAAELFQQVQKLREVRARQIRRSRRKEAAESPPKLIAPQGRGLTLKYLLTGLLRCAGCNASLRPVPTGRRSKGGKRYVYYACPRHYDGACANSRHLPEDQLRDAVLARLRARLFPPQGPAGQTPPWLPELVRLVGQELGRYREQEPIRAAAGRKELQEIERQVAGWGMTLGDPSLPEGVRKDITAMYERAIVRKQGLEQAAAGERALQDHLEHMLDPKVVIGQLQKLGAVLAGFNPTLGNLELSKHIDRIVCHPDGKIEMRGTLLGLFEGAVELLSRTESEAPPVAAPAEPERYGSVVPRAARLRVPDLAAESAAAAGNGDTALDPERFTSLPEPFLWSEVFVLDRKLCWAQEHSVEVARLRATGLTMERLAAHFGMSTPTIRKALQLAPAADESVRQLPRKVSRRCWAEEHAAEVAGLRAEGLGVEEIARRLGKSDTTIRAALRHARHRTTPAQDKAVGQGRSDVAPHDPVPARNIKRKENP